MQFTVPQFIEHESKIIGPFTMKQFVFVGMAALTIVILWFSLGKTNFLLFLFLALLLVSGSLALAFIKINGKPLPQVLMNVFNFSTKPKIYLWERKESPMKMIKISKALPQEKFETKGTNLKFAEKSRLNSLAKELEIK
jgi:hypothetical protein